MNGIKARAYKEEGLRMDDEVPGVACAVCLDSVGADPLWRTKKSHFRPSDEMSMKNVDKDAVNTKISLICYLDA